MRIRHLFLPSIALGSALLVSTPRESHGFSTLGHSLAITETHFRIHDNFIDASANDNTSQDAQFPGWVGAELAIWKGCVEWSSDPHGDGSGDPSQGELGSGDSNFDPMFTGAATSIGGVGDNVHSALNLDGGGTLAFMQGGAAGWWCRYYENWTWFDGPGSGGFPDLQSVACHEYGHALGMGHSSQSSATMFASGGGIGGRSINADDQAGIQSIYGHRDGTGLKPRILSAVNTGGLIHLVCENLTLNSNQVWFTRASANPATGPGAPVKVTGVTSTNGNTELTVLIPGNAGPGDVIVKAGTPGQAGISAPFPFDPQSGPILVPSVTSISTGTVEVLTPAGGETVSLFGTNLTNVYEVTVDGVPVGNGGSFDGAFTVVDDGQVDVEIPLVNNAGMVDLVITAPGGSVTTPVEIVPVASPVLAIDQPDVQEAVGLDFAVSAQPADVVFLLFSPLLGPTVVPGVLDWEIGNGNPGAVFNIKTWSIGPKLWRKQHFGPLSDLTPGVVLHFEGWVFEAANGYGFPSSSTNAVSRTVVP